jgi:hypothetical protein
MKKLSLIIIAILATTFSAAHPALAQRQPQAAGDQVYRLRITPMAPVRPAMKYRLLPSLLDQTPGNAAQLYLLGASQVPTVDELNNRIDNWLQADLTALPRKEIDDALGDKKVEYCARFFEKAARREVCHWETTYKTEGYEALLPHLLGMRNGMRMIALRARLQIADGDFAGALHSMQTGMGAAQHLNNEAVLIQQLVSAAIARMMLDDVTEWVGRENSPNLYWALAELPRPFNDVTRTLDNERFGLQFSFPELRDLENGITPEQWQVVMKRFPQMLQWDGGKSEIRKAAEMGPAVLAIRLYPQAKKYFIEKGMPKDKVEAMPVQLALARYLVQSFQEESDEVLKWSVLPYWQAREQMMAAEQAAQQAQARGEAGPLGWMVASVRNARGKLVLLDRRIASLQCVEGIRAYAATHDGKLPDSLADLVETPAPLDPVTNQPFAYELKGDTGVLNVPPIGDGLPDRGWKYEITIAK